LNAFAKLDEEGAKAGNADDQVAVLIGIFLRILQHCAVNHIEIEAEKPSVSKMVLIREINFFEP